MWHADQSRSTPYKVLVLPHCNVRGLWYSRVFGSPHCMINTILYLQVSIMVGWIKKRRTSGAKGDGQESGDMAGKECHTRVDGRRRQEGRMSEVEKRGQRGDFGRLLVSRSWPRWVQWESQCAIKSRSLVALFPSRRQWMQLHTHSSCNLSPLDVIGLGPLASSRWAHMLHTPYSIWGFEDSVEIGVLYCTVLYECDALIGTVGRVA